MVKKNKKIVDSDQKKVYNGIKPLTDKQVHPTKKQALDMSQVRHYGKHLVTQKEIDAHKDIKAFLSVEKKMKKTFDKINSLSHDVNNAKTNDGKGKLLKQIYKLSKQYAKFVDKANELKPKYFESMKTFVNFDMEGKKQILSEHTKNLYELNSATMKRNKQILKKGVDPKIPEDSKIFTDVEHLNKHYRPDKHNYNIGK